MSRRRWCIVLLALLVPAATGLATSHASSTSPDFFRSSSGAPAPPEAVGPIEFETQRQGNHMTLWGNNPLFGPVQVRLSMTRGEGAQSSPALPLVRVLAGNRRVVLAEVDAIGSNTGFTLESVPGDPLAEPADVVYSLPLDTHTGWELGQGFHGDFSHEDDANRFAVDLIVDEGTPVLAARGGVVMEVASGFGRGSADKSRDFARANFIRILHEDGSMALYAHLREGGVLVKAGESVGIGQVIGLSGNTGFTSGPHLHFCVQANRDMRLVSIPFRMVGPLGFLPLGVP